MPTTHATKATADKGKAIAHELKHTLGDGGETGFADNRPEAQALGSQIQLMRNSAQAQKLEAVQRMVNGNKAPIQRAAKFDVNGHAAKVGMPLLGHAMFKIKPWLTAAQTEAPLATVATQCLALLNAALLQADKSGLPALLTQVVTTLNTEIDRVAGAATPAAAAPTPAAAAPAMAPIPAATAAPLMAGSAAAGSAGPAAASVVHTPAPAAAAAPATPTIALKSFSEVVSSLEFELDWWLKHTANPQTGKYNTGFNGEGPNEVVSRATLAQLVTHWKPANFKVVPAWATLRPAQSATKGVQTNDFMWDFLVEHGSKPAVFNFHIEVTKT